MQADKPNKGQDDEKGKKKFLGIFKPSKKALIKQIRKRRDKIQKLEKDKAVLDKEKEKHEEEIRKMVKIGIKDGRLQRIEEVAEAQPLQQQLHQMPQSMPQQMPQMQPRQQRANPFDEVVMQQEMQEEIEQIPQQMPQMQPMQQQMPQMQPRQQQMPQMQPMQHQMPQMQPRQQIPPLRQVQSPQIPQPTEDIVAVTILLVDNNAINVQVSGRELQAFVEGLSEAIDNQSSFQVNNQILNGRNVILFQV